MQIDNKDKREYYELEAANNGWTGRLFMQSFRTQACNEKEAG